LLKELFDMSGNLEKNMDAQKLIDNEYNLFNYGKKANKDTDTIKSILYRPIPLYKRKEVTKVQN